MKSVIMEELERRERFDFPSRVNHAFVKDAIAFILGRIDANLDVFTSRFPAPASHRLVYSATENTDWTTGFWTGMLWLAYEVTRDDKYLRAAEIQVDSFKQRIDSRFHTNTHDLGFLYTLSCVASYKLTANREAADSALKAADQLMERYHPRAGIIQAWGDLNDPNERGRMIIDCCMNLPLLYWASGETGNSRYSSAASEHVSKAASLIVREDASTYHTFFMDIDTGLPKHGETHQGYADDSCWSRGQAWGLYGFALSYIYTGEQELLELAKKLTNFFLNRLPEDLVCYWDLIFTRGDQERDSSAAAIAACGMLELARHLPLTDQSKRIYENAAACIIESLTDNYSTVLNSSSNGILKHAVYNKPRGMGIDECTIWGDYFYFEALVRLLKDWRSYW
ncbi:glycoside hydrolase family 88 protein [Paenibacillus sp. sptzw28]|uniref:glycoside hydrolase family 88 protein n=1 Tax=Paenibacillus sp. sptzw28 TaxID=715179 RepID=UPI001C6EBA94|nr:glycoside hydrolase family 88 protein [Paenibacillus sp. sptzw28]QYR23749.1 glycoside hydrolase family 88 protein [Paenibacillus sp. sptzw28]